jgi:hypothetical protein
MLFIGLYLDFVLGLFYKSLAYKGFYCVDFAAFRTSSQGYFFQHMARLLISSLFCVVL